ncbi:MAG: L-fucose:H+ symporter permease [Gemmatimonadetes bacterium]|nr:L-fucose:H+ symporter permease [Gemmatimonadota bacterium]
MTGQTAPLTERRFLVPLMLITSLFFLWALGVNLNDILIPHLKKALDLTDFQSSLIQTAFFGGYFLAARPAGWLMRRVGYKRGILTGLMICATGTLLFLPAAATREYAFFLLALFVMACGQCFLEVAANPYVTVLGPPESAARRLNTAQAFNSVGALVTPILGATFILSGVEYSQVQLAAMGPEAVELYRITESQAVRGPYLVITAIFLIVAFLIWRTKLPDVVEAAHDGHAAAPATGSIMAHGNLVRGVIAQFCYVGAQVGVASFVIRFAQQVVPGTAERAAAGFLKYHLLGFMLGRFLGSAIMQTIPAPRMLAFFAAGSLACAVTAISTTGAMAIWAVVLIGFFHSIMFPTIFALALDGLGAHTKFGSSLLVMSIVGGAILPAVMGYLSDVRGIQTAFIVPALCYLVVFHFGFRGYRHPGINDTATLESAA